MIKIGNLTMSELVKLRRRIDKKISNLKKQNLKDAKIEVRLVAKKYGVTIGDIAGIANIDSANSKTVLPKSKLKGRKLPIKYIHPEDPSSMWTGRGRKPKWVEEALESGYALTDLLK